MTVVATITGAVWFIMWTRFDTESLLGGPGVPGLGQKNYSTIPARREGKLDQVAEWREQPKAEKPLPKYGRENDNGSP